MLTTGTLLLENFQILNFKIYGYPEIALRRSKSGTANLQIKLELSVFDSAKLGRLKVINALILLK